MSRHTAYDMYGRSAVYQAIHSNSIASVISLDLAMQSLYDGRYARL